MPVSEPSMATDWRRSSISCCVINCFNFEPSIRVFVALERKKETQKKEKKKSFKKMSKVQSGNMHSVST